METGLTHRVALICGGSEGIGRATALAFAAEGTHLALCARNVGKLEQLADEIRTRFTVKVHTAAFNVQQSDQLLSFVESTAQLFGRLDICVANAGGPPARGFLETTDKEWEAAFAQNLQSAVNVARFAIPHMQRRRWGRIVVISSITVRQPQPQLVLSNTIRAGVLGLIRSLSNEFAKDGITANNVGPGYTATNRLLELKAHAAEASGRTGEQIEEDWIRDIPVGRLAKPEEVADAVVWFASERAAFITGQTLLVDGGMYKGL